MGDWNKFFDPRSLEGAFVCLISLHPPAPSPQPVSSHTPAYPLLLAPPPPAVVLFILLFLLLLHLYLPILLSPPSLSFFSAWSS